MSASDIESTVAALLTYPIVGREAEQGNPI
jgi:hypothetical protein